MQTILIQLACRYPTLFFPIWRKWYAPHLTLAQLRLLTAQVSQSSHAVHASDAGVRRVASRSISETQP